MIHPHVAGLPALPVPDLFSEIPIVIAGITDVKVWKRGPAIQTV
jgi:hypothetical protein